jgi:hypothetical protein
MWWLLNLVPVDLYPKMTQLSTEGVTHASWTISFLYMGLNEQSGIMIRRKTGSITSENQHAVTRCVEEDMRKDVSAALKCLSAYLAGKRLLSRSRRH